MIGARWMKKWRETPRSRRWLGVLILMLIMAVGVQGFFIHRLSTAMENGRPIDPGSGPQKGRSNPFGFSDPWGQDLWGQDPWGGWSGDPFEQMKKMREKMDRLFNSGPFSGFNNDPFSGTGLFSSPMDGFGFSSISGFEVRTEDDEVVVTGKIPGADQSSIDVSIQDRQLRIAARTEGSERQTRQDDGLGDMMRQRQFSSRFEKRVTLPEDVDPTGMKTEFEDGVLTVRSPRKSTKSWLP